MKTDTVVSRDQVNAFLASRRLALVGVSRKGGKFGNMVLKELKAKGYEIYPVHPEAPKIDGSTCWESLAALPEGIEGVIISVPPAQTDRVVVDAVRAGIRQIWMQQGSESPAAIAYCRENGVSVIHGECILMFAEPSAFFHRAHRWVNGVFGRLPQ